MTEGLRLAVYLVALGGAYGLLRAIWRRTPPTDRLVDDLIAKNAAVPRFEGFDPDLRTRTAQRRQSADALHASAHRVATKDRAMLRRAK